MNDQALAEKIVAILGWSPEIRNQPGYVGAGQFVRDPRVAMAMMEKCAHGTVAWEMDGDGWLARVFKRSFALETQGEGRDESLPRAINEACAEALSND